MVKKFREVATLSRLQHQHVVRYYQVQMFINFCTDFRIIATHVSCIRFLILYVSSLPLPSLLC